jgi:serine protease Do
MRGWLGVVIQDRNGGLTESFGSDSSEGVLVQPVIRDGLADKAGLKADDIITRFDGKKVTDIERVRPQVAETGAGTQANIKGLTDAEISNLKVEAGEPEAQVATTGEQSAPVDPGMTVRTVTPEIARHLGHDPSRRVVVTDIELLGPAERAGIQVRDVVVSVPDKDVENVSELRSAMGKHDPKKRRASRRSDRRDEAVCVYPRLMDFAKRGWRELEVRLARGTIWATGRLMTTSAGDWSFIEARIGFLSSTRRLRKAR